MKLRASILILGLACFVPLPALAQLGPPKKIADGVWANSTPDGANVGWFVNGDEVVMVDAGPSDEVGRMLLEQIRTTAGRPVKYVVITHAHADHAGGLGAFAAAGAEVICAENAAPELLALMQSEQEKKPQPSKKPGGKKGAAKKAAAPKPVGKPRVLTLSDRLRFLGGARRFEIYYLGPAHTDNDLIVVLPEEKVLFSGDIALNNTLPFMRSKGTDSKSWEQILRRISALPVDQLVPGHGRIGTREGIEDTLFYVRRANEIARKLVENKVTEEQLDQRLREPEYQIEKVFIDDSHIANMKAVYAQEKARATRAAAPAPSPAPTRKPG